MNDPLSCRPLAAVLVAVVIAVTALGTASPATAMCPAPQYRATVLTRGPLPSTCNLLVSVTVGTTRPAGDSASALVQRGAGGFDVSLELVAAGGCETDAPGDCAPSAPVTLRSEVIGPGLVAFSCAEALADGVYTLRGNALASPREVTIRARGGAATDYPAVTSVVHDERVSEGGPRGGGRRWSDTIRFAGPVPASAAALLFEFAGSVARFDVTPGESHIDASSGDSHCGRTGPADNSRLSFPRASVSFVDHYGEVHAVAEEVSIEQVGALARDEGAGSGSGSGGASGSTPGSSGGCGRCTAGSTPGSSGLPLAFGLFALLLRRRSGR